MSIKIHPHHKAEVKMKALERRKNIYWPERQELPKPEWLRKKVLNGDHREELIELLKKNKLVTVCQEASCPNLVECFHHKIATFMILGSVCTRRCSFCDVAHGIPNPPDLDEPRRLAETVLNMGLKYVVITSVDRDDLRDGGASHFARCIDAIRQCDSTIKIECLVPDFRKRQEIAMSCFEKSLPDVLNHNLETVEELYPGVRPGSDYYDSLRLLRSFKNTYPEVMTKSGIMLGLGETADQIKKTLKDLREYLCDAVTIGQYLPPSRYHHPLVRYVSPDEFGEWEHYARSLGFQNVASGPFVRSSYQAEAFSRSFS